MYSLSVCPIDVSHPGLRPRAILSKERAIEIFEHEENLGSKSLTAKSIELVHKYKKSSKTILASDIWSGPSGGSSPEATCFQRQQPDNRCRAYIFVYLHSRSDN